jgi:hypothetical protein
MRMMEQVLAVVGAQSGAQKWASFVSAGHKIEPYIELCKRGGGASTQYELFHSAPLSARPFASLK